MAGEGEKGRVREEAKGEGRVKGDKGGEGMG